IRRRILVFQIAPALERAPRPRHHRHQLLVIDQAAMGYAVLLNLAKGEQLLPRGDLALDHPIERTAVQHFVAALGGHTGDVHQFRLLAFGALFLQALFLPVRQFRQAVAANTKLNDVKRHATANNGHRSETQCGISAAPRKTGLTSWKSFLLFLTEFLCVSRPKSPATSSSINPPWSHWRDAPTSFS